MHATHPTSPLAVASASPATVLAATAEAFRSGAITWGQDFFTTPTGCRCVLGGLAWAIDPATFTGPSDLTDPAGRLAAEQAMDLLAELLVDAYGAPDVGEWGYYGTWCRNPIEVVGDWNDAADRTLDDVLELLDDAAARAARTAATQ